MADFGDEQVFPLNPERDDKESDSYALDHGASDSAEPFDSFMLGNIVARNEAAMDLEQITGEYSTYDLSDEEFDLAQIEGEAFGDMP